MKTIFANKLRTLRKMRGLSLRGLCAVMDNLITPNAISKYERGEMMPSSAILIAIAKALSVNLDELFTPITIAVNSDTIKYRKKSTLTAKERHKIQAIVDMRLQKYIEVEQMCGELSTFDKYYPDIEVSDENDARSIAARFRRDFDLGVSPISTPIELFESLGVKFIEIEASNAFDGDSFTINGTFVIVLNSTQSEERKRLSLFHEIGHKVMRFKDGVNEERLCNIFANEVILPSAVFISKIGNIRKDISYVELEDIQIEYGISIEAMIMKARQLNIISENRCKSFFIQRNRDRLFREKIVQSKYPKERTCRYERLVYRLLASDAISESKCASLLECSIENVRNSLELV